MRLAKVFFFLLVCHTMFGQHHRARVTGGLFDDRATAVVSADMFPNDGSFGGGVNFVLGGSTTGAGIHGLYRTNIFTFGVSSTRYRRDENGDKWALGGLLCIGDDQFGGVVEYRGFQEITFGFYMGL